MKIEALRLGARVEVVMHGASEFRGKEGEGAYILAYDDPFEALSDALRFLDEVSEALAFAYKERL